MDFKSDTSPRLCALKAGILLFLVPLASACKEEKKTTLHEFSHEIASGNLSKWTDAPSKLPKSILHRGQEIFSPWEQKKTSESTVQAQSTEDGTTPRPSFRPDREARLVGTAKYAAVFSPNIMPFKRLTALDHVSLDGQGIPILITSSVARPHSLMEAQGLNAEDRRPRDSFWGNFQVDLSGGNLAQLPTISPESQILSLQTKPEMEFELLKDRADNWWIQFKGKTLDDKVSIVYLINAPQSYFGGPIPNTSTDALMKETGKLPPRLKKSAQTFLQKQNIQASDPISKTLSSLVQYFRSFKESENTVSNSGNIFQDILNQKIGVCRHRVYAFVILAQALGIPSRFVHSDAHAWAEVKLPQAGWMRIDLGGALEGLEPHGLEGRQNYRPRLSDPFPWPDAEEKPTALGQIEITSQSKADATQKKIRALKPQGNSNLNQPTQPWIQWTAYPKRGSRGQKIRLEGYALGVGAIGLDRVELTVHLIFLDTPCKNKGQACPAPSENSPEPNSPNPTSPVRLLGTIKTNQHGYFKASLQVPKDIQLGTHVFEIFPAQNE